MPRFDKTYCSSCHGEFGPGDHGYSHCESHGGVHWMKLLFAGLEPDEPAAPAERIVAETPPNDIWHRIYEARTREANNVA